MSGYTRWGATIWNWSLFVDLDYSSRNLWSALYTSPRANTSNPGLFVGSIATMAESAHMPFQDAHSALARLTESSLVEFDPKWNVLRFLHLPDAGEWPSTPTILIAWWKRFQMMPVCSVRDAHVLTLRDLIERGARESEKNGKMPSEGHEKIWSVTFGTVKIPPSHIGGRRVVPDDDTSTDVQPSLFPHKPVLSTTPVDNLKLLSPLDLISAQRGTPSGTQRGPGEGEGVGEGRSGSDPDQGDDATHRRGSDQSNVHASEDVDNPVEETISLRPALGLVPLPPELPFSVTDMLAAIAESSEGRFSATPLDQRLVDSLCATIHACGTAEVGLADLRCVGKWLASGGLGYRSDLGPSWVAKPGTIIDAVGQARVWTAKGGGVVGTSKSGLPRPEPAPIGAHGNGRRRL